MNTRIALLSMVAVLSLVLVAGAWAQPQAPANQGTAPGQGPESPPPIVSNQPGHPPDAVSMPPGVLVSTESLLGVGVKNPQGERVGDLKQLMIDHRTGHVRYAVVAMGGFLGMGEKTIIVPWQALQVVRDGRSLTVTLLHQGLEPTPTEAPAGAQRSGGWGVETPYGRLYNPVQEQTISGRVVGRETAAPMPGMAPGLQVLVQTDEGQATRVHVGPEWYLDPQHVEIRENTRVQITGAPAEVEGQTVLLAREVQFDGYTLTLRDAQGVPMWNSLRRSAAR